MDPYEHQHFDPTPENRRQHRQRLREAAKEMNQIPETRAYLSRWSRQLLQRLRREAKIAKRRADMRREAREWQEATKAEAILTSSRSSHAQPHR